MRGLEALAGDVLPPNLQIWERGGTWLESKSSDLGTWQWRIRQVQTRPKSYDLDSSRVP